MWNLPTRLRPAPPQRSLCKRAGLGVPAHLAQDASRAAGVPSASPDDRPSCEHTEDAEASVPRLIRVCELIATFPSELQAIRPLHAEARLVSRPGLLAAIHHLDVTRAPHPVRAIGLDLRPGDAFGHAEHIDREHHTLGGR